MKRHILTILLIAGIVGGYFSPLDRVTQVTHEVTHEVIKEVPQESPIAAGASLPQAPAVFETSLASPISTSATSLTLTANSVRGGSTLSGYNCFTIDEGTASREDVCGTVSSTAVSGLTRGIDPATGTSTVASLQFTHRRGASVKITDFPTLTILRHQMNGSDTIPNALSYASHPTFTIGTQIVDKTYADGLSYAGVATSTESSFGGVWLATALQQASSTDGTPNRPYVLQSKYSTSTCAIAGLWAVITGNSGKINQSCLDLTLATTLTGAYTFNTATTTLNATTTSANGVPHFNNGNFATTTAGATINGYTLPVPVSMSTSTKRVVAMDGNDLLADDNFMGFAVTNGTNGTEIVVQTDGVVNGFSGLTVGRRYYVQDAVGTIGTSVGTYDYYVGIAASTTAILIDRGDSGLQYVGTCSSSTCTIPPMARMMVINSTGSYTCAGGGGTVQVQHTLFVKGATSAVDGGNTYCDGNSAADLRFSITSTISGGTLSITQSGMTSVTADVYFYR